MLVVATMAARMVPDVPRVMAVHDRFGPHLFGAGIDAEHAVDAAGDATDNGADHGADRAGHAVAFMEAVACAGGNALRLSGERQRREARGGEDEFELHGSRPFHCAGETRHRR